MAPRLCFLVDHEPEQWLHRMIRVVRYVGRRRAGYLAQKRVAERSLLSDLRAPVLSLGRDTC